MRVFIAVLVLAFASPAAAQATAPCADTTLHFEYQVDQPARWIVDTSLAVHPIPNATSAANVVQFFVDTAGAPEPRSFRPLEDDRYRARACGSAFVRAVALLAGSPTRVPRATVDVGADRTLERPRAPIIERMRKHAGVALTLPDGRVPCPECAEAILPQARRCPYCRQAVIGRI